MRLLLVLGLLAAAIAAQPAAAVAAPPRPASASTGDAARFAQAAIRVRPRTTFRPRSRFAPRRTVRRSPSLRRIGGGILRVLGIAYLLNLLFGWGSGGSPLGLLLLLGIVVLLVTMSRRRRHARAAGL